MNNENTNKIPKDAIKYTKCGCKSIPNPTCIGAYDRKTGVVIAYNPITFFQTNTKKLSA